MEDPAVNSRGAASSRTSLTLLERVRQNNRDAWDKLVSLYAPLVYHWCKLAGFGAADAEAVGHRVFLEAIRCLPTFTHDGTGFRGWLRHIARREIADHVPCGDGSGGAQGLPTRFDALDEDPASVALEKNILYRRAIELLEDRVEPATLRAFWLLLGGRKATEVAVELRMGLGAVYTARSRVVARVREEFGDVLNLGAPATGSPPADRRSD